MRARAVGNKVLVQVASLTEEISDSNVGLNFKNNKGTLGVVLDKGSEVPNEIKKSDLVVFSTENGIHFSPPSSTDDQFLLTYDAIYAIIDSGTAEDSFESLRRRVCGS